MNSEIKTIKTIPSPFIFHGFSDETYILDSYAWIEYFSGSEMGKKVKEYIESRAAIVTPTIVLAELAVKFRKDRIDYSELFTFIKHRSRKIDITFQLADLIGKIHIEMRKRHQHWPLYDSIILATAKMLNCKLITGDEHFRGLENVIMLK